MASERGLSPETPATLGDVNAAIQALSDDHKGRFDRIDRALTVIAEQVGVDVPTAQRGITWADVMGIVGVSGTVSASRLRTMEQDLQQLRDRVSDLESRSA